MKKRKAANVGFPVQPPPTFARPGGGKSPASIATVAGLRELKNCSHGACRFFWADGRCNVPQRSFNHDRTRVTKGSGGAGRVSAAMGGGAGGGFREGGGEGGADGHGVFGVGRGVGKQSRERGGGGEVVPRAEAKVTEPGVAFGRDEGTGSARARGQRRDGERAWY